MDDNTLAPFVDALASALIMMVLVAVFFLLQSITEIEAAAKVYAVSPNSLKGKNFKPIFFHVPIKVNMDKKEILYMSNFDLSEEDLNTMKSEIIASASHLTLIFKSDDSDTKITANLLRLLQKLDLPSEVKIKTVFAKADSTISKVIWEF